MIEIIDLKFLIPSPLYIIHCLPESPYSIDPFSQSFGKQKTYLLSLLEVNPNPFSIPASIADRITPEFFLGKTPMMF